MPHQTTQPLTSGEDFVTSNPHTCPIGKTPLCQVSQRNFSWVCGSRSFLHRLKKFIFPWSIYWQFRHIRWIWDGHFDHFIFFLKVTEVAQNRKWIIWNCFCKFNLLFCEWALQYSWSIKILVRILTDYHMHVSVIFFYFQFNLFCWFNLFLLASLHRKIPEIPSKIV